MVLLIITVSAASAAVLNVPADYTTIQAGINASVAGDTVLVADGTYSGDGNTGLYYSGRAITVTSENGPEFCTIDCNNESGALHLNNGETASSVFSGFTVINGNSGGLGLAVRISQASPTISHCIFRNNGLLAADDAMGGVMALVESHSLIDHCVFEDNSAASGGAIYISGNGTLEIVSCDFTGNDAYAGGAIAVNYGTVNISSCTFESNHSADSGGAISSFQTAEINITNSTFTSNTAGLEGFLLFGGGAIFYSQYTHGRIENCTFTENLVHSITYPGGMGGAIRIDDADYHMYIDIVTCTFIRNMADMGGAVYDGSNGGTLIINSEFSENRALIGGAIVMGSTLNTIGGSADDANTFTDNHAGAGADLLCTDSAGPVLNAQFNQFSGNIQSDYFISPQNRFDLNGSTGGIQPVNYDIYVSPDGNNSNSGISPAEPVQSISYALQRIASDETLPHTVYLAAGIYSRDTTGEQFPLACLPFVTMKGYEIDPAVLDLNANETGVVCYHDENNLENLVIRNGSRGIILYEGSDLTLSLCRISNNTTTGPGAGIFSYCGQLTLNQCAIIDNTSADSGGGIFIAHSRSSFNVLYAWNCEFSENTALYGGSIYQRHCKSVISSCSFYNNTAEEGGGYHCTNNANPTVENCLFYKNTATEKAGAIFVQENSHPIFRYCTITGNSAGIIGGGMNSKFSYTDISHCIFWANIPDQIHMFEWEINAEYSIIQGGFEGEMIFDQDPLFVPGPLSDYYLSQTAAGDGENSPALDTGKAPADTQFVYSPDGDIPLSEMATRTDEVPDMGQVDIGVHFDTDIPMPTPTPTPTSTPTPTLELGVRIEIPASYVQPGDLFYVHGYTINPGPNSYEDIPLVFVLDVYGLYYFWPGWQLFDPGDPSTFEYRIQTVPVGETFIEVYPTITWPETGGGRADNLYFWGAMLTPDFLSLFGQLDYVVFGFGP